MCYKEWPECYKHCDNCDNLRHKDDLILVTDGAVDPDEKMICAQCASKQLSALRNEVRITRIRTGVMMETYPNEAEAYINGDDNVMRARKVSDDSRAVQ